MSSMSSERSIDERPDRQPVAWLTVLLLAAGMALADGFVVASLLVVVAATAVGIAAVAVSSVRSYGLQAQELRLTEAAHFHPASSGQVEEPGTCSGSCEELRSTLAVHVRGTGYAGGVLLGTNRLLVAWVVALRGGELEPSRARRPARP